MTTPHPALTMQDLAELKAKAEAASTFDNEEKWRATAGWIEDGGQAAWARSHERDDSEGQGDQEESERAEADAAFIEACSPAAVLALLAMATEHLQLVSAIEFMNAKGHWQNTRPAGIVQVATDFGWKPENAESPEPT